MARHHDRRRDPAESERDALPSATPRNSNIGNDPVQLPAWLLGVATALWGLWVVFLAVMAFTRGT
jgi:phage terminase small subunit